MAAHILLDNSDAYGVASKTGITMNATKVGDTSAAYHIDLRSFLMTNSGTSRVLKYQSSNGDFHFGSGDTLKTYTLKNNACAFAGGAADCKSSNTALGDPDDYEADVYFTPRTNKNGSSSTTITIYDGDIARATVTLTAKVIPTYYFKATSVATDGKKTLDIPVKASFESGVYSGSTLTVSQTAATADVASLPKVAYYYAPASSGDYQFQGWYRTDDCSDTRITKDNTISCTITSNSLNSVSPVDSVFYAKYLPLITAEFSLSNQTLSVDGTYSGFSYDLTSESKPSPKGTSGKYFWYEIINDSISPVTAGHADGTNVISYDAGENILTAVNGGKARFILHQNATGYYEEIHDTCVITVNKYITDLDGFVAEMLVDATPQIGSYKAENTSATYPSEGTSNDFYYTITNTAMHTPTNVEGCAEGHESDVIGYTPSTHTITAYNAGTAKLTIAQKETYKYTGDTLELNVTVSKHEPVFTWNGNVETNYSFEYYFNSVTNDIFQTTSGSEQDTIITTDNEYSAMMLGDSLMVYNVAEVAHITIRQPENYKWNAHEKTYTITPKNYANTLPLTYTESSNASYTTSIVTPSDNEFEWSHTDEIKLIGRGEKYLILHFNDMPDKLYYKFREQSVSGNGTTWYIMESETMETWDTIKIETRSSSQWPDNPREVQLSPTTRYVKLCYTGNRDSQYKGIRITKLENFESNPKDSLKFGLQGQNYGQQVMTVNFDHANAGRVTTVAIEGADADKFTVTPNEIAGTGRDLAGSSTLRVSFDNKRTDRNNTRAENVPYVAKLVITDNAGHRDTVNMTGYRHGKSFPQFTFNPNHMPYYYNTTIHNIVVSTNNDTSITVTSSDNSIAEIVDGKLEIKNRNAEVTITVSQPEKGDFRAHTQTFKFTPREEPPLKLPFIMTKTIYDNNKMVISKGEDVSWTDDGYIRSGWSDWQATASGRYWDDRKVFVVEFANAPDKLSFTAKNTYCSINCRWKVEQSSDSANWSQVFYKNQSCKDNVTFSDIQLDPSTRYLRFQYGGNYTGYFKDINVTCLDGYKYMLTPDNKYLSRGAEWGTQAVVGEFGVPVRVTRSTTNNTDVYTQVQYMDSREYLYEAGGNLVFTDNKTASNNANIQWKQEVVDGKVKVQSANPGMGGKYITVGADNKLVMTSDAAAAIVWEVEDYTIHQARIDAKLDAKAAEAARRDFGAEINTMAKVRTMLQTEEFDSTIIALSPRAISEVKGIYRYEGTTGTKPIFDTVVSGLDTGFYCLTVQAFYRPSVSPRDWENHANGMESHPAYVYANGFKFPIKSVFDETGRHSTQFAGDTLCPDGWYPANLASAVNAMSGEANQYKYWHDLYVYVHADEGQTTGTLRFGVKNPSYVPGTWLVFGNFTLTKLARKMYYFDNEGSQSNIWSTINDWEYKEGRATSTPGEKNAVTIQSDVEVAGEFKVYSLTVDAGKTVTIDPTGGLTIGVGGVSGPGKIVLKAATSGEDKGKTGYIRISPDYEGEMPEAEVELHAKAYYPTGGSATWQMVGAPIADEGVKALTVYKKNWVYSWDESKNDWVNNLAKMRFEPFIGFETTQKINPNGATLTYNGQLVAGNEVITKNLAFTDASHGYNAMANSYAAPIAIENFNNYDAFVNAEQTVYILNAGTKAESETATEYDQAGKFFEIPVANAATMAETYGTPLMISSMQGFFVKATGSSAQLKFNYEELVWKVNYAGELTNKPLRAPKRTASEDGKVGSLKVTIYSNDEADHLYMLESENYDVTFENGYDAHKMKSAGMNIFSIEGDNEQLSVDATNSIIGTRVGVRTGEETAYTMTFSHVNSDDDLTLWDIEAEEKVEISEGQTYTFFAEPNSEITGRFIIVEAEAPEIATGISNDGLMNDEMVKAKKFVKDDKLFILKNGVLYDATGMRVR